jgi:hypothetical protein
MTGRSTPTGKSVWPRIGPNVNTVDTLLPPNFLQVDPSFSMSRLLGRISRWWRWKTDRKSRDGMVEIGG